MTSAVPGDELTAFDRETSLVPLGPESFEAELDGNWWVGRGAHGGYLAAIILRALEMTLDDPERSPRSLTIHFCAAASRGRLIARGKVERSGASLTTLSGRVEQDGRLIALALAAFSKPWPSLLDYECVPAPPTPDPEQLEPLPANPGLPPFTRYFDYRFCLGPPPYSKAEVAETGGWLSLKEPRALDAPLIATMGDAWLPAVFSLAALEDRYLLPTIDYTVHFRRPIVGRDGMVKILLSSRMIGEGFFEEDGLLWDRQGRLLAQSRQLALLLPEPEEEAGG
jgi:acyl-CoA thioesterase